MQSHPFYQQHRVEMNTPILRSDGVMNPGSIMITPYKLLQSLVLAFKETVLFYSLFLNILLECPYDDYQSVIESKSQTVEKELKAAVTTYHPTELDYYFLTHERNLDIVPFAKNIPQCQEVGHVIHAVFNQFRPPSLFPKISTKLVDGIRDRISLLLKDEGIKGDYGDVERVYMELGVQISSHTIVKSAWKFNDLKPRVFYSCGATRDHVAKYIQPVFNALVDLFPAVHTFQRHTISDISISRADIVVYYDYTSFTTSLHEVTNFLIALSKFFKGSPVDIFDFALGWISVDLGELLEDYAEHCNSDADFDVSKILDLEEELIIQHNTGMLGS